MVCAIEYAITRMGEKAMDKSSTNDGSARGTGWPGRAASAIRDKCSARWKLGHAKLAIHVGQLQIAVAVDQARGLANFGRE